MMPTPEPFLAAEIDYRRERIAESFAAAAKRRDRRRQLFRRWQLSTEGRRPRHRGIATSTN